MVCDIKNKQHGKNNLFSLNPCYSGRWFVIWVNEGFGELSIES